MSLLGDVLIVLGEPERWTQGACARDPDGTAVDPLDDRACCWDLLGAVYYVDECHLSGSPSAAAAIAIQALRGCNGDQSLTSWNDSTRRTHAEVLQLVRRAIRAVRAGRFSRENQGVTRDSPDRDRRGGAVA